MADITINKFTTQVVRTGSTPSSAGFAANEGQNPVEPSGSEQNHLPVTIAPVSTALAITSAQVLSGAGTVGQYIRGDGSLADFPASTGGGSSVSYYLNGSISQGTIGGVAYRELNKAPVFGAGTDISINADGYIASFITDANDPNLLEIPGGNWNLETYFSASSNGGTPSFYVELYKYNGTTFTLIASNVSAPEFIAFGTNLNPYFSTLAVPTTVLLATDRLAIRYYVNHSGRTITLHTENNHLCQVITTFTTGLTALNGLTDQVQFFQVGTAGNNFNISSISPTHTFNLPSASASNRGALTSADWTTFNNKESAITAGTTAQYFRGDKTFQTLNTAAVPELTNLYYTEARVNANTNVAANTAARHAAVTLGTTNGLSLSTQQLSLGLASAGVTGALSGTDWSTFNSKENAITAGTTAQYYRGDKTFQTLNTAAVPELTNLYYTEARVNANTNVAANTAARHNAVTLGTANGLSLSTQQLSLGLASSSANGALSSTDWNTFNSKQNALTNPVTGIGTSGQIAYFNGTTTITSESGLTWDAASNRLTIGLLSTNVPLIVSSGNVNETVALFTGNNAARGLTISTYNSGADDSGVNINAQHSSGQISLSTAGNQRVIVSNGSVDLRNTTLAASSVYFDTTYQDALTVNSLGRVLINKTDDNGARLQVSGRIHSIDSGVDGGQIRLQNSTGGNQWYLAARTTGLNLGQLGVADFRIFIANSGNVGIGTSTPAEGKLVIDNPSGSTNNGVSGNTLYLKAQTANANLIRFSGAIATDLIIGRFGNADNFSIGTTGGSTIATFTASGNLGLGVTPSAWVPSRKVLQINSASTSFTGVENGVSEIWSNSFLDTSGTSRYVANGFANLYQQNFDAAGGYRWFNAPSGTAGNAISFTQAMTLFATGNLLVGSPSPISDNGARLQVTGAATFENNANSAQQLIVKNTTAGSSSETYLYLISDGSSGSATVGKFSSSTNSYKIITASNGYLYNGTAGDIAILNDVASGAIKFAAGASSTAHFTIASTGAATFSSSVTATAPSNAIGLQINGRISDSIGQILFYANNGTTLQNYIQSRPTFFAINTETNTPMHFGTNMIGGDNIRMTITGAGNVGIGTTSPSQALTVNGRIRVSPDGVNGGDMAVDAGGLAFCSLGSAPITFQRNNFSAESMRITSNGNVLIGTTTNGASKLRVVGLPTSAVGLSSGDIYNMAGVLMIA